MNWFVSTLPVQTCLVSLDCVCGVMCGCVQVNLETMRMYSPLQGKLRRTHYEGVNVKFTMSESDYSLHAKIGYVQVLSKEIN